MIIEIIERDDCCDITDNGLLEDIGLVDGRLFFFNLIIWNVWRVVSFYDVS